jgi:hypothetical protein
MIGEPLSSVLSPLLRRGERKKTRTPKPCRKCANVHDCSTDFSDQLPSQLLQRKRNVRQPRSPDAKTSSRLGFDGVPPNQNQTL